MGYYFIFSQYGLVSYWSMCKKIKKEHTKIAQLKQEITSLKNNLETADTPFEKETIARCDYGMGYTNELVYVMPKEK